MCAIKEEMQPEKYQGHNHLIQWAEDYKFFYLFRPELYEGTKVYGSLQRQIEVNNYVAEQLGRDEKYCKFCGTTKEEDCKCNDSSNQYGE